MPEYDTTPSQPDDMKEELAHLFREQLSRAQTQPDYGEIKFEKKPHAASGDMLSFHLKPKDVKAHLDRFVIRQDEAKQTLAIAVCDHYNHVKRCLKDGRRCTDYSKQNVIMIGPPGVGKTYLIQCIAELIGVPFVKADATKFSETGYVGGDVEDLVRELVHKADGDISLAEYGIIYLDEIDKIAGRFTVNGRDVSGFGVQRGLLKLMEETEVALRSPLDMASQMQSMMEFQKDGKIQRKVINTKHILFIVSGAFEGITGIVKKRVEERQIGFAAQFSQAADIEYLRGAQTRDFIEYGFEPEFIGRLPVRVACSELSAEDLFEILRYSEGSIIKQYIESFASYGIDVIFTDEALREIAGEAGLEKTGARGLLTVTERALRQFKYELPSSPVRRFAVGAELIRNPAGEIERVLRHPEEAEHEYIAASVLVHKETLTGKLGIGIVLSEDARDFIYQRLKASGGSVEEVFHSAFLNDFKYGVDLIKRKGPGATITLTKEAFSDPKRFFDTLIKQYYTE